MGIRTRVWFGFFLLLSVFLIAGVSAADKVVVIPLNSCKDSNLLPENICLGITIVGVTGTSANCNPLVTSNGRIWMDRNLGASQAATSATDTLAYGGLYQWGRLTDGHEKRDSPTVATLSPSDNPGHGSFILVNTGVPQDWLTTPNDDLWQGVTGTNNPCPAGFRLPTSWEWDIERSSWSSQDAAGAFGSPLKLVAAGYRELTYDSIGQAGRDGNYWSSTLNKAYSGFLRFTSTNAFTTSYYRAYGRSVRCIKD